LHSPRQASENRFDALPLSGINVVDLSRFIAGPWCAMLLSDMGADVVKVERPGGGDDARACGPFCEGRSLYFAMYNRNKKSLTLNLRSPGAREVLERLVTWADVMVENFRPGVLEGLGLSYKRLADVNPRLVLVSISGFGQEGPFAHRPCFDTIAQAMSGVMDLTGDPAGPPTRVGVFLADFMAGVYGALGALLALVERARTGRGKHVDVAMLDSLLSLLETNVAEFSLTGIAPTRTGNRRPYAAPVDAFRAVDGYVFINVSTNSQWEELCGVIGRPDLKADPRFGTPFLRGEQWTLIHEIVGAWVRERRAKEVEEVLNNASVPAAVIASIGEIVGNPQVLFRRVLRAVPVPGIGRVMMPANPVRFVGGPEPRYDPPPDLGEHTTSVLQRLGFSEGDIDALQKGGAL